uniref:Uncharacterized protein n=1 Tax=viral metagenome TaxID=1070528 RepID=A0A6C0EJK2_9ZZZZ
MNWVLLDNDFRRAISATHSVISRSIFDSASLYFSSQHMRQRPFTLLSLTDTD